MSATTLQTPWFTGPIRIDALEGHAPTWRPDHGDDPIYQGLVAEWGPPGLLVGPALSGTIVGTLASSGRHA